LRSGAFDHPLHQGKVEPARCIPILFAEDVKWAVTEPRLSVLHHRLVPGIAERGLEASLADLAAGAMCGVSERFLLNAADGIEQDPSRQLVAAWRDRNEIGLGRAAVQLRRSASSGTGAAAQAAELDLQ
jgi:hypothetical protein